MAEEKFSVDATMKFIVGIEVTNHPGRGIEYIIMFQRPGFRVRRLHTKAETPEEAMWTAASDYADELNGVLPF